MSFMPTPRSRGIVFTSNLLDELSNVGVATVLVKGLSLTEQLKEEGLVTIPHNDIEILVTDNGVDLTFMLPGDY